MQQFFNLRPLQAMDFLCFLLQVMAVLHMVKDRPTIPNTTRGFSI